MQFKILAPVLALVGTSLSVPVGERALPAVPAVPALPVLKLPTLPTIPTLPVLKLPTLPTIPNAGALPIPKLPTLPTIPTLPVLKLPTLPTIPTLPVLKLPTLPTIPNAGALPIPKIPTLPALPDLSLPAPNIAVLQGKVASIVTVVQNDLGVLKNVATATYSDSAALVKAVTDAVTDIKTQLQTATVFILSSTVDLAASLADPEIAALLQTIQNLKDLATTFSGDLKDIQAQLGAGTFALVKNEIAAVGTAVKALTDPVVAFSQSVKLSGSGGSSSAVVTALSGLGSVLSPILASLGL